MKAKEKKFSPVLEIADLELENIVGGAEAQNSFTVTPVPVKTSSWLNNVLKTVSLHSDDSSSEVRR